MGPFCDSVLYSPDFSNNVKNVEFCREFVRFSIIEFVTNITVPSSSNFVFLSLAARFALIVSFVAVLLAEEDCEFFESVPNPRCYRK